MPTLRRDHGGRAQLMRSLAQAFTAGVDVDWTTLFPADPAPRTVDLPTYAFQRERYWLDAAAARGGDPADLGLTSADHPLLGAAVELADGGGLTADRAYLPADTPLAERACGGRCGAGAGRRAGGMGAAGGRRGRLR